MISSLFKNMKRIKVDKALEIIAALKALKCLHRELIIDVELTVTMEVMDIDSVKAALSGLATLGVIDGSTVDQQGRQDAVCSVEVARPTAEEAVEILTNKWDGRIEEPDEVLEELTPDDFMVRITRDPEVMAGKPCIRGLRFPVSVILSQLAEGQTPAEILADYPYIQAEDIPAALAYASLLASNPPSLDPRN